MNFLTESALFTGEQSGDIITVHVDDYYCADEAVNKVFDGKTVPNGERN